MPKFKVGDKVTVGYFIEGEIIYIRSHSDRNTYDIKYDGYIAYSIEERCISLVNNIPKFEMGQKVAYIYKFQAYVGIITARHYEVGLSASKETTYDITTYGNITHENIKESYVHSYVEETKYFKYYVRGLPREIPFKLSDLPYLTDEKGFIKYPKIETTKKLENVSSCELIKIINESIEKTMKDLKLCKDTLPKNSLFVSPIKLSKNIKIDKDGFCVCDFGKDIEKPIIATKMLEKGQVVFQSDIEDVFRYFHFDLEEKIPNKLPDRVVFNSNKGKTTILFSLHDNGLPPYAPFTSKTVGSDKFDRSMGFLIAYYKYINREMNKDRLREQIELIFGYNKNDRTMYLSGAIEQALLPHYTKERIFEVFEAILKCEGTFDLLQYEETKLKEQRKKEALRKKNINKQIKKREIEIKGLKEKL